VVLSGDAGGIPADRADAVRSAGLAAGTLAELLAHHTAAVDLSGVALVVRAQ